MTGMARDHERPDLGFTYQVRKNGDVEILRHGHQIVCLRGSEATDLLARAERASEFDLQQLLARLTGNYKRGNERLAGRRPRNGD
jgi:hypothetical protein